MKTVSSDERLRITKPSRRPDYTLPTLREKCQSSFGNGLVWQDGTGSVISRPAREKRFVAESVLTGTEGPEMTRIVNLILNAGLWENPIGALRRGSGRTGKYF